MSFILSNTQEALAWEYSFIQAIKFNSKTNAIKAYREWKKVGFREASDYVVENWTALRQEYK